MTDSQMTDDLGVACDVHQVRVFSTGQAFGAGYDLSDPATWFVYARASAAAKWYKHNGPYASIEQATEWILAIRETGGEKNNGNG